jgi:DNA polymerase I
MLPDGCEPCRANSHYGYFFDAETFKTYQNELEALAERVTVHAGRNHWHRPYRFGGDDFIEFLGWFITEGSVTSRDNSDSAVVQIAQELPEHRRQIASLLERMDLSVDTQDRSFSFGSVLFARLLTQLCGSGSRDMHLPEFIWECSTEQKELLLRTLIDGDGHESTKYYTASRQLAEDIMRLQVELGMKPRYGRNGDIWRLSLSTIRDGFKSSRNVSFIQVTEPMYQLTIEDFSLIMAGRNRAFQWIGVSNIS